MPTPAKYIWRPSLARSVALDGFGPVPRGTPPCMAPLAWPAKDPNDVLDYVLDLSPALIGNDDDTITDIDVEIDPGEPGDLALQSAYADGERAVLWLALGQPGTTYTVTLTLVTSSGRTLARSISLPVMSLATPAVPTSALTDQNGNALTDQNGNPLSIS